MNATLAHEWISRLAGWAAEASLSVLLPALAVLCISRLRLIPARWCALLAALLLARLMLPAVVPVSWRPGIDVVPAVVSASVTSPDLVYDANGTDVTNGTAMQVKPAAASVSSTIETALPLAWSAGAIGVLAWLAFSYLQVRRLATGARPADAQLQSILRECARAEGIQKVPPMVVVRGLPSVAIFGWLSPRLLVPEGIAQRHTAGELRGIFLHELQHVKRGDCVWTWLGLFACAMHWFNPLAWMLFRRFCADRELACDEAVLDRMQNDGRRSYGEALIKTAERYAAPSPMLLPSFSSNPTELKHRMKLIMKPQSKSLVLQLVSAIVGIGITTFTFTTARADGEKEKPAAEKEGTKEKSDEVIKKSAREGDGERKVAGDGEGEKKGARDGETKKSGARDGEGDVKKGQRDGEGEKKGPRDGEMKKSGARDGEGEQKTSRDGDAESRKKSARDGEGDGEKKGARDSEGEKTGPRDGETKKSGTRDGEGDGAKKGAREGDGDGKKSAEREGGEKMREGERGGKTETKTAAASAQQLIIQVNAEGNVVNSKGDIIDLKMVRGGMKDIANENPDQSVILRADANTAYAKVLNVLDALKDAGLKDVKLEGGQK